MNDRRHLLFSLPFLLAVPASAQSWALASPASNPGPLRDAGAAFHAPSGQVVLFGGWPTSSNTWVFDDTNWANPVPATVPPARREPAMAQDLARGVVVMFGGQGASVLNDTWEWDGTNWTQVTTANTPPARTGHSLAYDLTRQRTVLFGGHTNPITPSTLTDTWEYDGVNWTQVMTANAPSEAVETAMCFDIARSVTVLYGGTSFFGAPDQKTWEYDGTNWTDVTGTVGFGPTAIQGLGLQNASMVYDPMRAMCVLHGGRTPNGTFPPETWSYDGTGWAMISSGTPSSRTGFAMAMDTTRDRIVLYGGATGNLQTNYTETWEFTGAALATYTPFGVGCPGSNGVPQLAAQGGSLPRGGQAFTVDITNLPAGGGFVFLSMGFDNTVWNSLPLPVSLASFGLPGCTGYIRIDASVLLGHASGTASHGIAIPTGLDGLTFYQQALSIDPAAGNALGGAVSNAGTAVVGN